MLGFTWDFNFTVANQVEAGISDEDDTFLESELVNTEILNSVNNKYNDTDNVNSLNIVNSYCVNNFYDSFQIDASNSKNTDLKTRGDIITPRKMNGHKSVCVCVCVCACVFVCLFPFTVKASLD